MVNKEDIKLFNISGNTTWKDIKANSEVTLLFGQLLRFEEKAKEEARKEIRKELDKILERLRGYGCGYHKQLEKQILNLKKELKESDLKDE